MGLTYILAKVSKEKDSPSIEVEFLVDSGASFTLLPEKIWQKLGLESMDETEFILADGARVTRRISEAWIEYGGKGRTVQVILGEGEDEPLFGALTLEAFGLLLHPFTRKLIPMRMMLAGKREKTMT